MSQIERKVLNVTLAHSSFEWIVVAWTQDLPERRERLWILKENDLWRELPPIPGMEAASALAETPEVDKETQTGDVGYLSGVVGIAVCAHCGTKATVASAGLEHGAEHATYRFECPKRCAAGIVTVPVDSVWDPPIYKQAERWEQDQALLRDCARGLFAEGQTERAAKLEDLLQRRFPER